MEYTIFSLTLIVVFKREIKNKKKKKRLELHQYEGLQLQS